MLTKYTNPQKSINLSPYYKTEKVCLPCSNYMRKFFCRRPSYTHDIVIILRFHVFAVNPVILPTCKQILWKWYPKIFRNIIDNLQTSKLCQYTCLYKNSFNNIENLIACEKFKIVQTSWPINFCSFLDHIIYRTHKYF